MLTLYFTEENTNIFQSFFFSQNIISRPSMTLLVKWVQNPVTNGTPSTVPTPLPSHVQSHWPQCILIFLICAVNGAGTVTISYKWSLRILEQRGAKFDSIIMSGTHSNYLTAVRYWWRSLLRYCRESLRRKIHLKLCGESVFVYHETGFENVWHRKAITIFWSRRHRRHWRCRLLV